MKFPKCQAVPYPTKISFQLDGNELFAYNYKNITSRPYIFPVIGTSGRIVTRIGHPHDPVSHSHHYSIWLGHQNVNGVNFWEESDRSGRQVHQAILGFECRPFLSFAQETRSFGGVYPERSRRTQDRLFPPKCLDPAEFCSMTASVSWQDRIGKALIDETRRIGLRLIDDSQYLIELELEFKAITQLRLGKTPFAFLGVRVAKTMGVHDGGGKITNSEGQVDEKEVFWKTARWCDYSGPVSEEEWNGITVIDSPSNLNHPPKWHVRSDGWMCPSLFLEDGIDLAKDEVLKLRYKLLIHKEEVDPPIIEEQYET